MAREILGQFDPGNLIHLSPHPPPCPFLFLPLLPPRPSPNAQTVFSRGAAGADGRLKRGDQILAVNAESFDGFTHDEAVQALKRAKGTVVLTIAS